MLGVRYGRLALAKLSSRRYEDRALEGERWIGKGIGKALQGRFRITDRISLKDVIRGHMGHIVYGVEAGRSLSRSEQVKLY